MYIFFAITNLYLFILLVDIISLTKTFFNVCLRLIGAVPASIISDFTANGSSGGMPNSLLPKMEMIYQSILFSFLFNLLPGFNTCIALFTASTRHLSKLESRLHLLKASAVKKKYTIYYIVTFFISLFLF